MKNHYEQLQMSALRDSYTAKHQEQESNTKAWLTHCFRACRTFLHEAKGLSFWR